MIYHFDFINLYSTVYRNSQEVLTQLIVDDDAHNRGHNENILNAEAEVTSSNPTTTPV